MIENLYRSFMGSQKLRKTLEKNSRVFLFHYFLVVKRTIKFKKAELIKRTFPPNNRPKIVSSKVTTSLFLPK